jgi:hypothetical protein
MIDREQGARIRLLAAAIGTSEQVAKGPDPPSEADCEPAQLARWNNEQQLFQQLPLIFV